MKTKIICLGACFALFLAACNGKKQGYYNLSAADSANLSANGDSSATLKLIKKGDMRFKVKNVQRTCEDVATLTATYGGIVTRHAMQSQITGSSESALGNDSLMRVSAYNSTADMTVRVPSESLEDFMNQLNKMAIYTDNRNMDIEDKTLDYLSTSMKVHSHNQVIARQKTSGMNISSADSLINIKDNIIDRQIENKRIDNNVRYSTVALSFYQVNTIIKEIRVNDDPSAFRLPLATRLKNSIAAGWDVFGEVLVFFANIWVLFVLAAIIWLGLRHYSKKKVIKTV